MYKVGAVSHRMTRIIIWAVRCPGGDVAEFRLIMIPPSEYVESILINMPPISQQKFLVQPNETMNGIGEAY